jgi:ectoine hydroxylase-related dioxygenase (phytanoyl-CoA dioxygenase family)
MTEEITAVGRRAEIADRFAAHGYYFPINFLSADEAACYRQQLEVLESSKHGNKLGNKNQLNYPHIIFRFADGIARNPRILDAVEAILGPDILVWGSTFFIKEPHSESYISWHQDLRYWGLDSEAEVSAWLALSPVTEANGCMRFVPGSHKGELLPHKDTFTDANFLTRGQEADIEIDDQDTILVPLAPGQASLHHGKLLHASAPNRSNERRIGLAINYLAPHVRQVVAKQDFAVLVRGEDKFGHFQHVPAPTRDMDDDAITWHRRILSAQNEAIYEGAKQPPL